MNYNKIGKEANHLKLNIKFKDKLIDGIGFGMVEKYPDIYVSQKVDIIGHLSINEWNNNKKIQIEMKEILL